MKLVYYHLMKETGQSKNYDSNFLSKNYDSNFYLKITIQIFI